MPGQPLRSPQAGSPVRPADRLPEPPPYSLSGPGFPGVGSRRPQAAGEGAGQGGPGPPAGGRSGACAAAPRGPPVPGVSREAAAPG